MARSNHTTLLSLDRFAEVIGLHPLHFNQVYIRDVAEHNTCAKPWYQHKWQHPNNFGRDELAQAIAECEDEMARHLRFDLMPTWREDFLSLATHRGSIFSDRGYIYDVGTEVKTLIEEEVGVDYEDADEDSYAELATIVVSGIPDGLTIPEEVRIYYPGHDGEDGWEIRPTKVVLDEDTDEITITTRRERMVLETKLEAFAPQPVDGTDDDNFLDVVDIYWRRTDKTNHGLFVATPGTCGSCAACGFETLSACIFPRDHQLGIFDAKYATWNGTEFTWNYPTLCSYPQKIRIHYRAGWMKSSDTKWTTAMDPMWERILAHYVIGKLGRPLCGCEQMQAETARWAEDLAMRKSTESSSVSYQYTDDILSNPLGSSRGAVEAWAAIQNLALAEPPVVG